MPNWRSDYLASLEDAERNNPVNRALVEACSQLADRVAALEAEKAAWTAGSKPPPTKATPSKPLPTSAADPTAPSEGTAQLRLDLAEALRGRGQAQARLKAAETELATLKSKTQAEGKRVTDLTAERNMLKSRVRDLNEELEKKKKFLKDVQDDNLTLNMELNMTTQKAAKVQAENKELVDRWMKRMGREADALNLQNESPKSHR
ncbi:autophagy-related protein 16 [Xylaria intraflava]|nr:autophagy-related protein 16 [Xylaria intraflava]